MQKVKEIGMAKSAIWKMDEEEVISRWFKVFKSQLRKTERESESVGEVLNTARRNGI